EKKRVRHRQYSCAIWLLVRGAKAPTRFRSGPAIRRDHARPRRAPELRHGAGSKKRARRLFSVEEPRLAASIPHADVSLVIHDRGSMHRDQPRGAAFPATSLRSSSGSRVAYPERSRFRFFSRAVLFRGNRYQAAVRGDLDRPQRNLLLGG